MSDASINFGIAATSSGRTWVPPRVRTDWDGTGYAGDRTIDDLSPQAGAWTVSHHLDDGLPDEVSFVAGLGTAELAVEMAGRGDLSARAYWSPLRTDSPIQAFERDIAPVTFDVGLVTEAGPDYVRIFTGQMVDTAAKGVDVALTAISAARLKLAALVHPPAVAGRYEGSRADWVISYALAASGVYLSPPPQVGCRFWMPGHGSVHPFIPSDNRDVINQFFFTGYGYRSPAGWDDQTWVTGPFHLAPDLFFGSNAVRGSNVYDLASGKRTPFADGDDMVTQAGLRGKIELWVRGEDIDLNTFPASSAGSVGAAWVSFAQSNTNGSLVNMFIAASTGSTDRKPTIRTFDGTTDSTFRHSTALPRDGAWHFVGMAYDLTTPGACKRWINLDGVVETDNTSFAASGFPASEAYATNNPRVRSIFPIAEVQITAGAYANPDNHPWLLAIPFTPGARMTPSLINLTNVAEREPREAWELIGSLAQSELAMMRTDEHDVVEYLGQAYWVKDAQQIVRDHLDTAHNAKPVPVVRDPTKIRNSTRVTYDLAQSSKRFTLVGTYSSELPFAPGYTRFVLPLTIAAVELRGLTVAINDGTGSQPLETSYVTLNTAVDGTGTYITSSQAEVTVESWHPGAATILVRNSTGANFYMANANQWPGLGIAGKPHYTLNTFADDYDAASIADRGERSLTTSSTGVQREVDARRLARELKSSLTRPVIVVGDPSSGIEVAGDPRRRPGMLVSVRDAETGIDDSLWRIQTVDHEGVRAKYRNKVTVRRVLPILVIGEGLIGRSVIGPNSRSTEPPYAI